MGKYHVNKALIPNYKHLDNKEPDKIKRLKAKWTEKGYELSWKKRDEKDDMQQQVYFCIYRFDKDEKENLNDPSKIVATTRNTYYILPYDNGKTKYKYVVTAFDR